MEKLFMIYRMHITGQDIVKIKSGFPYKNYYIFGLE